MQQPITFRVVYAYDRNNRLRKNGTAPVLVRAYQSGRYAYFNTGVLVEPAQWCRRSQRVKKHPRERFLNTKISQLLGKLEQYEATITRDLGECNLDQLKRYEEQRPGASFIDFVRQEMTRERNLVTDATYRVYEQTLAKLEAFRPGWTFTQLEAGAIRDFLNFLYAEGLHTNTVHKHFKNVKKFVRLAWQRGYLGSRPNPCDQIKLKRKETDPLFLTEEELTIIEGYQAPQDKPMWQLAQQCFLFTAYTGLRYSDVSRLTEDNFTEIEDGLELAFTAQKTGKPYRMNIRLLFRPAGAEHSLPEQIIRRRQEADDHWPDHPLFPFAHRNSYVRMLKRMARSLPLRTRVREEIASHTGRHTFGCIMTQRVKVEVLQDLMQHSFLRETQRYAHLTRRRVREALENVEW